MIALKTIKRTINYNYKTLPPHIIGAIVCTHEALSAAAHHRQFAKKPCLH